MERVDREIGVEELLVEDGLAVDAVVEEPVEEEALSEALEELVFVLHAAIEKIDIKDTTLRINFFFMNQTSFNLLFFHEVNLIDGKRHLEYRLKVSDIFACLSHR